MPWRTLSIWGGGVSSTRQLVLAIGRLVCLSVVWTQGLLLQYGLRDLPRRLFRLADRRTSPAVYLTSMTSSRGRGYVRSSVLAQLPWERGIGVFTSPVNDGDSIYCQGPA